MIKGKKYIYRRTSVAVNCGQSIKFEAIEM